MTELTGCCVMVVEDEFQLARDIGSLIELSGAQVMGPYPRPELAMAALKLAQPDCAIIDVNTGHGPDFTLADWLYNAHIPFIFFTGYDRWVIPSRFLEVTRLEKPVDTGRLLRVIGTTCQRARVGLDDRTRNAAM